MPSQYVLSLLCCFLSFSALAKPSRFLVKDAAYRNLVYWVSDAPLEKTLGVSHFISGWVELDPQNLKAGIKGEWEVDVRSFEMGTESKTAKLREALFAAADFPGISFKAERFVESPEAEFAPGKTLTGKVLGTLVARGQALRREVSIKASYFPESELSKKRLSGNLLKVSAVFEVPITLLKVVLPDALVSLVAPVIAVHVDFVATDQIPMVK
jgi:polyisoprenoid-binding protein YceI